MAPMKKNRVKAQIAEYALKYRENHYRLAYSYVRNVDDALDIVQESILKAISSTDSLKNSNYIKTWFYKIIVNTSLDFLRKQGRTCIAGDEVLNCADIGSVDDYMDFDLQKALDNLPDKYRTIVILRYFEDMKIEEIAEVLAENVSTVKTRLYKSLERLRIKLGDNEEV